MIENLWKKGSDDWEPFGKKGEQNDEQDQEPLEKKGVFFNLQQQIFGKKILLLPEGSPFKMKEPLEKRSKPGCLKVAKLLAQPWCTSPAGRKKGLGNAHVSRETGLGHNSLNPSKNKGSLFCKGCS